MAREITSLSLAERNGKLQERRRGVQRRGQRRGAHHAGATAGLDEVHFVEPADFVFHADAAVELDEVGADAEEHVLAVIYDFASTGMLVGRCATAEIGTALEKCHAEAGIGEGAGGGETGEAASGDGYGGLWGALRHSGLWRNDSI